MKKQKKNKSGKRLSAKHRQRAMSPAQKYQHSLAGAQRYFEQGDCKAAAKILNKILTKQPDNTHALLLSGLVNYELGNQEATEAALEKAVTLSPTDPDIQFHLGIILQKEGKYKQAIEQYRKTLDLKTDHALALSNLGTLLQQEKDFDNAIEAHEKAIRLMPSLEHSHINLGEIYQILGDFDKAIQYYLKGLELNPVLPVTHNNLGLLYKIRGEQTKAIAAYRKAIELDPTFIFAYSNMATALLEQGKLEEAQEWFQKTIEVDSTFAVAKQNALLALNYSDTATPQEIFERHRSWGEEVENSTKGKQYKHNRSLAKKPRIRIGYVSPDFWQHAVASFIEPILANHNHDQFEIICYADVKYPDQKTVSMQKLADKWYDIRDLNNDELAALVFADNIDILVDLTGHSANSRLRMFAFTPAPVQATYLGYPNTTGMHTMDYRLTDNYADPEGMTETLHTETLVRLPQSFLCYKPPTENLAINDLPALNKGYITFGSFNNRPKITDTVIKCWAQILNNVPNSQLVLKSGPLCDEPTRNRLLEKFTHLGIQPERLIITAFTPTFSAHMQLYNTMDIGLDTFPYNGTTTTFEALWMGIPVVTISGKTHAGRVGVSILNNIALSDLIAEDQEEYIRLATDLAQDTARLKNLRNTLRQRLASSPFCDNKQFVNNLENTYWKMITAWNNKGGQEGRADNNEYHVCPDDQKAAIRINQIGEQFFTKNKLLEAVQIFQKAIELDPNFEVAHNNLGVISWQSGNIQEAIACFQKALEINPTNIDAIDNLAAVLKAANNKFGHKDSPGDSFRTDHNENNTKNIVWIASYPKSGNTWVRFLLLNLIYGPQDTSENLDKLIPDIHKSGIDSISNLQETTLVKTHFMMSDDMPLLQQSQGVIYIVRNPIDVMLSNLNYLFLTANISTSQEEDTIKKEFIENFIKYHGMERWIELGFGAWDQHVNSWIMEQKKIPHLLIKYEDLLNDPVRETRRINEFLGLNKNEDDIKEAVHCSSFESMKHIEEKEILEKKEGFFYQRSIDKSTDSGRRFLHKGKKGSGKQEISPEYYDKLIHTFKPQLETLRYIPAGAASHPKRRLHIGGKEVKPGWEIFNAVPAPDVNHIGNAKDLSRFPDNTFSEIYASHVLEHFDYKNELSDTLQEWKRVLMPGGKTYLSVPDLDTLSELFLNKEQLSLDQRFHVMRMMFGGHVDQYDYHTVGLNFDFLSHFLQEVGFINITRVKEFSIFNDTSSMLFAGVPISLNVIAEKA